MEQNKDTTPIDPQMLIELVRMRMPFGKYKNRILCDLPEPYRSLLKNIGTFVKLF
jgi:hypothetical protein